MAREGGGGQNRLALFIPNPEKFNGDALDEEGFHLLHCKLLVCDHFDTERCLYNGLARVWIPRDPAAPDDGDPFYAPQYHPSQGHQSRQTHHGEPADIGEPFFRKVEPPYESPYRRPPQLENPAPQHYSVGKNDSFLAARETQKMMQASSENPEWGMPQPDYQVYDNVFEDNMVVENYINLMDSRDGALHSLDALQSEEPNKDVEKMDYETLLPPSVVEAGSYLTLHSAQSPRDAEPNYHNIYEGLFDNCEDVQDHISIVNEEIEKKIELEQYLYDGSESFVKEMVDCEQNDETYSTDITEDSSGDRSHSTRGGEVKCNICGRRCKTLNALNHHMLVHSEDRPFVCEICKKAFKEQPTLRRHMWTHMDKQHQCDICQKYFVEKSSLRRHISTIHADFKPGQPKVAPHAKQQFGCKRCGKLFKSQTKFNMHAEMHGNPNFECEICGKVYAGRSHLRIHQRIHTGEKPFVCTICNMQFAFKHVLKSHQARIHQKIHKFKCNLCSLTFVKKSDLSSHASCHIFNLKKGKRHYGTRKIPKESSIKKASHKCNFASTSNHNAVNGLFGQLIDMPPDPLETSEDIIEILEGEESKDEGGTSKKKKECCECFKAFERMGDLKRHIISHIVENISRRAREENNGAPVYECQICDMVFKQVDKFKKHLREHAKLTLYQCDVCDRAFGDSSNFSKHKKVHGVSYLKCSICNRKFNTKRMMVRHMEYHRHNKPKNCAYCKKLYHFESNLRKHIKIAHLSKGKMTYKCTECGDRFDSVKLKWEHQWEDHGMRKVVADCYLCDAQFRKYSLLRAHLTKEHAVAGASSFNRN